MKNVSLLIILFILFLGKISLCINTADSIKSLIEQEENTCNLSRLHLELSKAYANKNLIASYQAAEKSIEYALVCNDTLLIADTKLNTAARLIEIGNKEQALELLLQAKQLLEILGETEKLPTFFNNVAIIYIQAEDYKSALKFLFQAKELAISTDNNRLLLFLTNNIGLCYQTIGKNDSALHYYEKSILMTENLNKENYKGTIFLNIGQCYYNLNKVDSSLYYYYQAMKYIDHLPNYGIGELYRLTSISYLEKNQFIASKQFLDSSKIYALNSNSLVIKKDYYETQYKFDSTIRNYKSAMHNLLLLAHINDSVKSEDYSQKMAQFKSSFDLEKQQNEIEVLKKQNELSIVKAKQKNNILIFFILLSSSLSTIAYLVYRSNKNKHQSIKQLNKKNNELNVTLEKLKQTQSQLIHSEKLASIGVLARGAAHEINNPLNYINGGIFFIDELLAKPESIVNPSYKKYIGMIQEGISRIKSIVDGLDTFTETKNEHLILSNINDLINQTLSAIDISKIQDIKLSKDYQTIPSVKLYPSKIGVVIFNILNNAIDATTSSSEKQITIKTKQTENKTIEIHIYNTGNPIELSIQNKIYDPFFTTKSPDKGSGLGLTIASNIVKEHDGSIRFINKKEGVGFIISLPVV